ncbi:MAG: hypothetical protein ACI9TA_000978 [Reinekea sp.]
MIEPRHDLKQPRSWGDLFFDMKGWLVLIAAVILAILTWASTVSYKNAHLFETEGVTVIGEVTAKRTRRSDDKTNYYVKFAYVVDANRYGAERKVGRNFDTSKDVGDPTDIIYWVKDPRKFEYIAGKTARDAVSQQILAGVVGVVALGIIWSLGGKTNRAVLARRRGRRTTATIAQIVERKNSGRPTGRGYMIFRTTGGKAGESLDHPIRTLHALGTGTAIVVFVRGNDVWWEGDVGPRAPVPSQLPKVPLSPSE